MGGRRVGIAAAGIAAAVLVLGGCASGPGPNRATPEGCYAFAVRAIQRHVIVRTIPPACAGLGSAQVDNAVDRAIRTTVGPLAKAPGRAKAAAESRYLAGLIRPVPAPPAASPQAQPAAPPASSLAGDLAALAAWIATAAAGGYLLAGRLRRDRSGRRLSAGSTPPPVILGHAGLGVGGLAVWVAFVITAARPLGWLAVAITFLLAGLGMATLLTASEQAEPGPATTVTEARPAGRPPVLVIAAHGALATATILAVLLAVIGAG